MASRLSDIRIWIAIFFIMRLYGITNPPLELSHSWRQVSVNTVARNFYHENNYNILFPKVDTAGNKSGITGMEFPLLNYIIFLAEKLFGYSHWYGRLINLIISSIGTYYFYLTVKKYIGEKIAFYAAFILLNSIWFTFSRKIMPDTFSMSLSIIGLYYGLELLFNKGSVKNIAAFFVFSILGILSKIPSAFVFSLLLIPLINKDVGSKKRLIATVTLSLSLLLTCLWYFVWVPYLNNTYEYSEFFMGKEFGTGVSEIFARFNTFLSRFYDSSLKYIGFLVFLCGLYWALKRRDRLIIGILGIAFTAFMVFVFKAGENFTHHNYYIVPFAPIMALIAGYGLSQMKNKVVVVALLFLITVECISSRQHDFKIPKKEGYRLDLENIVNSHIESGSLIAVNGVGDPIDIYYANRKGWNIKNSDVNISFLSGLKNMGCRYFILNKHSFDGKPIDLEFKKVYEDPSYTIFQL